MYDPIIGSFIHSLDNAASDIHVPISLLLIQILDIIFQSIPKSHYMSSSFWMPGRNFTTVFLPRNEDQAFVWVSVRKKTEFLTAKQDSS